MVTFKITLALAFFFGFYRIINLIRSSIKGKSPLSFCFVFKEENFAVLTFIILILYTRGEGE